MFLGSGDGEGGTPLVFYAWSWPEPWFLGEMADSKAKARKAQDEPEDLEPEGKDVLKT